MLILEGSTTDAINALINTNRANANEFTPDELRQAQAALEQIQWQAYKNYVAWYTLSFSPKEQRCAWCGEVFTAAPNPGDEHEAYCSKECEQIQGQIDAYESYQLDRNEQRFLARFEHPTEF